MPIFVLLDNIRAPIVDDLIKRRLPRGSLSREEGELGKLASLWDESPQPRLLSFPWPDIWCALPEPAVRRVSPTFPGWDKLVADYRKTKPMNFKDFVAERLDVDHTGGFFLRLLAAQDEETERTPGPLDRVVEEIIAVVSSELR